MLTDRAEGLMRISRFTKYLFMALVLPASAALIESPSNVAIQAALVPATIIFLALMAFGPSWFVWSRTHFQYPMRTAFKITTVECLLLAVVVNCANFIMPIRNILPPHTAGILVAAVPLLFMMNRFLPDAISTVIYRWRSPQRILTIGSEEAINLAGHQLDTASRLGLVRIDHNATRSTREGLRIFNPDEVPDVKQSVPKFEDAVLNHDSSLAIDRVMFVDDAQRKNNAALRHEIQRQCDSLGVPLTVYTDGSDVPMWNSVPVPLSAPTVSRSPCAPLQNPVNQFSKRCIDILISLPVVIFILPPLCLLIRFIHRKQSPGRLFYRQERCGRNGTKFRILKFRTMHAPAEGETDIEDNPGPRIFQLGALLRDSRLDEIPQFINVLAGTMSVVGPRAHHTQDRVKFSTIVPHYPLRMQTKPGITGLAQYREYRGMFHRNSIADRVTCDLKYITNWTLESDLVLMASTASLMGGSLARAAIQWWQSNSTRTMEVSAPVESPSLVADQRAA